MLSRSALPVRCHWDKWLGLAAGQCDLAMLRRNRQFGGDPVFETAEQVRVAVRELTDAVWVLSALAPVLSSGLEELFSVDDPAAPGLGGLRAAGGNRKRAAAPAGVRGGVRRPGAGRR